MISTAEPRLCRQRKAQTIVKQVQENLERSAYSALKTVSCECDGESLVLKGKLPNYYYKQLAQEAVRRIEGIVRVINKIEVELPLPR